MTVQETINRLMQYPDDAFVVVNTEDGGIYICTKEQYERANREGLWDLSCDDSYFLDFWI